MCKLKDHQLGLQEHLQKPKLNFARLKVKLGEEVNFNNLIQECQDKIDALHKRQNQAQAINQELYL